ncbi:autotransporter outer membrane beta-barrel domain-containing protein [Maliponia aquimaris]|uniref:Autotransporter domain-containing protein n=1 Tax=Maliponia aquimaris TaxID=1673631 RepID=A0A238K6Q4_9RHOB|nr:autotransporter outer membrane beta-barrel domain-containing protein [Maliponia aquimaris]SMX38114.1 hypothetical protein MAA8898_01382 [Maliponia aquimaris]
MLRPLALTACLALAPVTGLAQTLQGTTVPGKTVSAVVNVPPALRIDEAPLSSSDRLSRELGFGIAGTALGFQTRGAWLGTFVTGGGIAPDISQGADHALRGAVAGYGFDWLGLSPFIGYGQGKSGLDDGVTETRIRSYFIGLGLSGETQRFRYGAAVYAGRSHNAISAPNALTGETDHDGRILGISLSGSGIVWQSPTADRAVDLRLRADVLHHSTDAHDLTGLRGGSIAERTATSTALRVELGMPMARGEVAFRPYLGLSSFGGTQDDIGFSLPGVSAQFAAADVLTGNAVSIGSDFAMGGNGLKGRMDLSRDDAGQTMWNVNLGLAF